MREKGTKPFIDTYEIYSVIKLAVLFHVLVLRYPGAILNWPRETIFSEEDQLDEYEFHKYFSWHSGINILDILGDFTTY